MTMQELAKACNFKIISGKNGMEKTLEGGYASDLLSDVMGNAREGQVGVTLQTHKNGMAVASLKELAGVVLVKGQELDADAMQQSNEEDIPVLQSQEPAFTTIGKIYTTLKHDKV